MDKVLDCIQATAVKEYTEKKTSAACGRRENSSSLSQTSNADGPPDLLFIFLTNKTTTTRTRVNEPFKQSTHLAREAVFLSRLQFIIDLCLVEFGEYQHTRADREHKRRQKGLGGERGYFQRERKVLSVSRLRSPFRVYKYDTI